jgi:hypothetical protein
LISKSPCASFRTPHRHKGRALRKWWLVLGREIAKLLIDEQPPHFFSSFFLLEVPRDVWPSGFRWFLWWFILAGRAGVLYAWGSRRVPGFEPGTHSPWFGSFPKLINLLTYLVCWSSFSFLPYVSAVKNLLLCVGV